MSRVVALAKLLREPLVHFVLLGACLFAVSRFLGEPSPSGGRVVVTSGRVEELIEGFRLAWDRPPTEEELRRLVDDYVQDEVMYREALAKGLDRGDPIVRARLRQKLQHLNAELVAMAEPTEEELRSYRDENPERYRRQGRFGFSHVYVRSENELERAASILDALRASPELGPEDMGDPFLYPPVFENMLEGELTRVFGIEFARRVAALPLGEWSGPVKSPYGWHVVRLDSLQPGRPSELDEVREAVHRDLLVERRRRAEQTYLETLLSRYTVTVEWPERGEPGSTDVR